MAATDWKDTEVSSELLCQLMRDINRLEYISEITQTTWYFYDDYGAATSLGTPDAGVSIPSLNALGDEWYRAIYIAAIREAIEGIIDADQFHDIADWKRYTLGEPAQPTLRKSLYALAAPYLDYRWGYDHTTVEQRYSWFVPTAQLLSAVEFWTSDEQVPVLVSQHFYDMFISEVFEIVKILKASAIAIHVTPDGNGTGASWDDPISFDDAITLANGYSTGLTIYDKPRLFMAGGDYELESGRTYCPWPITGGFDGELVITDLPSTYTYTKFDGLDDAYILLGDAARCEFTGVYGLCSGGAFDDCYIHHNTWTFWDALTVRGIGCWLNTITNSRIEYNSMTLDRSDDIYGTYDEIWMIYGKFIPIAYGACRATIMDNCTIAHNYSSGTKSTRESTPGPDGGVGQGGRYYATSRAASVDRYFDELNEGDCGCHAVTVIIESYGTPQITNCTFDQNRCEAVDGTNGAAGGNGGPASVPGGVGTTGGRGGCGGLGGSSAVVFAAKDVINSGNIYTGNTVEKGIHGNGGDGGNGGTGGVTSSVGGAGGDGAVAGDAGTGASPGAMDGYTYRETIESSSLYERPGPINDAFADRQAFWVYPY